MQMVINTLAILKASERALGNVNLPMGNLYRRWKNNQINGKGKYNFRNGTPMREILLTALWTDKAPINLKMEIYILVGLKVVKV